MTFKVGDRVRHNIRGRAEVMYGPYTNTFGREHCVIGLPSGRRMEVPTDVLSVEPQFAVGDEVRNPLTGIRGPIVAGPFIACGDGERYWVVEQPDGRHSTPREDRLSKVVTGTVEHDGVVYTLLANYRDKDGDLWRFAAVKGIPRGGLNGRDIDEYSDSLASVADEYGPLTKI